MTGGSYLETSKATFYKLKGENLIEISLKLKRCSLPDGADHSGGCPILSV